MNPKETIRYIDHRLKIAQSSFEACFEPDCWKLVYQLTRGVPRVINRLCDTALLISMTHKAGKVTRKILRKAHKALESDFIVAPEAPGQEPSARFKKLMPALAAAVVLVALIALGFFGYRGEFGRRPRAAAVETAPKKERGALVEKHAAVHKVAPAAVTPPGNAVVTVLTPAAPAPSSEKVEAPVGKATDAKGSRNTDKGGAAENPARVKITGSAGLSEKSGGPAAGSDTSPTPPETAQAVKPVADSAGFIIVTVKKGDSLYRLAARWFPEGPVEGLKAIVAANPRIHDENRIITDQTLKIPRGN